MKKFTLKSGNKPSFKQIRTSPLKKAFDFTKSADYSTEATKGGWGEKIAKAVTPQNLAEVIPIGKIGKAAKTAWNYFRG